ncbi:MAG: hypothetical protein AMXMBFR33_06750 [Candidatus Xenobia bacterium]
MTTVVLHDPQVARNFPVQLPLDSVGASRANTTGCKTCGSPLEEVLITTFSSPVWDEWPLAVDGWSCRTCQSLQLPRFLEAEEVERLSSEGAQAVRSGHFAEAELAFRRICNSWPRYGPGRENLARALQYWLAHEEESGREALVSRLAGEIERQLRDALEGDGLASRLSVVSGLVNCLLRREDTAAALALLAQELSRPEAESSKLQELRVWVEDRGDLYHRGVALLEPRIALHERPQDGGQAQIKQGIALLERHLEAAPENWPAMWFAGKGYQALGQNERALEHFRRCLALKADQSDVARECAITLMKLGRFAEAIEVSRQACQSEPGEGGLQANLAIACLLGGQLEPALEAARRAVELDGSDAISASVLKLVQDVREGRLPPPTSAAQLGF